MKYFLKRGGSSGASRGGGGGAAPATPTTPSGVTYDQFMQMSVDQRHAVIDQIINDPNIVVPSHVDKSVTSKVLFALGMDQKPTVASDSTLDAMSGKDLYRTVYDNPYTRVTSKGIVDQIKTGDYTQLSGSGGSVYGRGLYFAEDFYDSAMYGSGRSNSVTMRAKLNANAKMSSYTTLDMLALHDRNQRYGSVNGDDVVSLYAIANGFDGWTNGMGYTVILNRGALTVSSTTKKPTYTRTGSLKTTSWKKCKDA